ncbi:MAG TPA: GntR family transcriptional regulator [Solirubrobacteraceae bacterium]|nr:GntR family transcriptional regulator [Solirubrobacteraceae bacterium]
MTSQPEPIELDDTLRLTIDRDADVPIGVQLAWAIRARIDEGTLVPEQRLPGLRDLADALGVNANTVRSVYQRLEREGVIDTRQGSGTFVSALAHKPSVAGAIAADAAQEAHETGVDPREVAAALYVTPQTGPERISEPVGRRRALRAQIAALEQALIEIETEHSDLSARPTQTRRADGAPRLLSATELEQTRTELVRRLAAVQIALDERDEQTAPRTGKQPKPAPAGAAKKRGARSRASTRHAPAGA